MSSYTTSPPPAIAFTTALLLALHGAFATAQATTTTTSPTPATNTTLIHGWVPEPPGRGTYSLLSTSLLTIILSTWSCLHLNVSRQRGWWARFAHKAAYMLVLTIAPEVGLAIAVGNLLRARRLVRALGSAGSASSSSSLWPRWGRRAGREEEEGWTMTHMLFACHDGFWVRTQGTAADGGEGEVVAPCAATALVAGINAGQFPSSPPVSREELQSRSRSDWAVKAIAVLQIAWFVVQVLVRVGVGYAATALEIMTAAYVFCSLLTYGVAWGAPQNVEFPVVLEEKRAAVTAVAGAGNVGGGGGGGGGGEKETTVPGAAGSDGEASSISSSPERSPEEVRTVEEVRRLREHEPWGWLVALPVGSTFGAIHCLAWHAPFPTRVERDIWRVCSGIMTGLPLFITPEIVGWRFLHLGRYLNMFEKGSEGFLAALVLYSLARVLIIVLAIISVRVLPADVYETVNWSQYIPHFGV